VQRLCFTRAACAAETVASLSDMAAQILITSPCTVHYLDREWMVKWRFISNAPVPNSSCPPPPPPLAPACACCNCAHARVSMPALGWTGALAPGACWELMPWATCVQAARGRVPGPRCRLDPSASSSSSARRPHRRPSTAVHGGEQGAAGASGPTTSPAGPSVAGVCLAA